MRAGRGLSGHCAKGGTVLTLVMTIACGPNVSGKDDLVPIIEFDPAGKIIPMPNNMLLDEVEQPDGSVKKRVNIPWQCAEVPLARDLREEGLNGLDGFGHFKPSLRATFTHELDEDTLEGRVVFACRSPEQTAPIYCTSGGLECDLRFDELRRPNPVDCLGVKRVYQLTATPLDVLGERKTCGIAILDGVLTKQGKPVQPSPTWYLTRQAQSPVEMDGDDVVRNDTPLDSTDIDTLKEFYRDVWQPHQELLNMFEALGHPRSTVLLAWEFTTQTLIEPLDIDVPGSPASQTFATSADVEILKLVRGIEPIREDFLNEHIAHPNFRTGGPETAMRHPCDHVDCGAIGVVVYGTYTSPRFSQERDNPSDLDFKPTDQWSDPYHPDPFDAGARVEFRAWFPRLPAPVCGYPIAVLGCGLSTPKQSWYPTATFLASAGIASVTIDAVNQGSRGVQVSDDPHNDCDDVPMVVDPIRGEIPQYDYYQRCFEHIIPTKLAAGRDNARQTVLDTLALARLISEDKIRMACVDAGLTGCDDLAVDGGRIGYEGVSMGGVLGTIVGAMSPHIKASVLTAGGGDWVDLFLDGVGYMRCPMVDGLIGAGILDPGDHANGGLWMGGSNADALCLFDDWEDAPAFLQIAEVARWILQPGDPVSFGTRLGDKTRDSEIKVLMQQMHAENAVSNATTANLLEIIGIETRDVSGILETIERPRPSPAICEATAAADTSSQNLFLDYVSNGNNFIHPSVVLFPTIDDESGRGAVQVQHDVAVFLCESLERAPLPPPERMHCAQSVWLNSYDCNSFLSQSYSSDPVNAGCPE